jgi:methyltransferase (TIGR00027 family)
MAEMKESRTALGVAWLRAVHQVLDSKPLILEDEPIVELLGRYYVERASKAQERFQSPGARLLRSHVVLRSRFAEDRLAQAVTRGVQQFVILGAGYDTFFARQPDWARGLKIFEIDQPATQEDKLARISAARLNVPENVVFGSVNFEVESVAQGLRRHGVRVDAPTMFSWLGVTMYLTEPAIDATLNTVLGFPRGSEIVLTFASRVLAERAAAAGGPLGRPATEGFFEEALKRRAAGSDAPAPTAPTPSLASLAADVGEPWLTYYEPDEIDRKLRHAGFSDVQLVTPELATERYFAGRADGLPPPRKASLLSAMV